MIIRSAALLGSAPDLASCPASDLPEFAFIGRSNVGKSSLVNLLTRVKGLAKVSDTPGKTRLINFFLVNENWALVDLPGYGYAKVGRKDRANFSSFVADYLQNRPNLLGTFVLIDSRLTPQKIDLEFLDWMVEWEAYRGRDKGWVPARLIRDNKISYGALTGEGEELEVVMSGKVYHDAETDAELPAVGDWVALEVGDDDNENVIRARLPRQNSLSRKMSGRSTEEQVIAANIDIAVVVTDAGSDFSLRRMERYFAIIGRSRA